MSLFKKKHFFSDEDHERIVDAVRKAERLTSGEVRVFVESRCRFVDAMDRAIEIFTDLGMWKTKDRNAVLLYIAVKDHQLAILGDEGIHKRVGNEYWAAEVKKIIDAFNKEDYAEGIVECVNDIGEALQKNFPYDHDTDKNELPDDIVFGS
jgi:uncharacterized membrane protein